MYVYVCMCLIITVVKKAAKAFGEGGKCTYSYINYYEHTAEDSDVHTDMVNYPKFDSSCSPDMESIHLP